MGARGEGVVGSQGRRLKSLFYPPGLRRARLGGPHLLSALRPLSDGAGTEDPRVKNPLPHSNPITTSAPSYLLFCPVSSDPSWRGRGGILPDRQKYTHNKNLKTNPAYTFLSVPYSILHTLFSLTFIFSEA